MSKCIICRRMRGGINLGIPGTTKYVLCNGCNRTYAWNRSGRYLRRRVSESKWKHQEDLYIVVGKLMREVGEDPRRVVTEVGFPDWGISNLGGLLRFDLAIPKLHILIDYHGSQHYTPRNRYHRTHAAYEHQVENDDLKRALAPINGYNYLIFSYREAVNNIEWVRIRMAPVLATPKVPQGTN